MAHSITFSPDAWADYLYWQSEDKKTLKRINKLLQELQRDGAVQGIGKAELLRKIKGMSKRIDDTNSTKMSSRFIEKENTFSCNSINIGYRTTNADWLKYIGASAINFTAYMNDIFRISSIKEERGTSYPFERSVSFSIGLNF